MAAATSPSTGRAYGVKRVCTIWGVARSSFYDARRQDVQPAERPAGRRGASFERYNQYWLLEKNACRSPAGTRRNWMAAAVTTHEAA